MRFYTLDLMRFFAALAVVLYHYTARPESNSFEVLSGFTKFGYLGVPLFFIISGFVICASAQNRTAMEFAVSRFVRLYPAYWLGIAITVTTVIWLGAGEITLIQVLANLTMLNDYVGISDVDGVFWTLQAELKFYGCIFLLSVFGVFPKFKVWLTIWMAITVSYLVFAQPFFMGWFISPSYSSLFIAGVLFYLIGQRGLDWHYFLLLACSLVVSSVYGYRQLAGFVSTPDPIDPWIAIALIWGFYLLFALMIAGKLSIKGSTTILALGGMTYPLYLIHNRAGKAAIDSLMTELPETWAVALVMLLVLAISLVIHKYLEQRIATPLKQFLLAQLRRWTPKPSKADSAT